MFDSFFGAIIAVIMSVLVLAVVFMIIRFIFLRVKYLELAKDSNKNTINDNNKILIFIGAFMSTVPALIGYMMTIHSPSNWNYVPVLAIVSILFNLGFLVFSKSFSLKRGIIYGCSLYVIAYIIMAIAFSGMNG